MSEIDSSSHHPQIFWGLVAVLDNGWMGYVAVLQKFLSENNSRIGSDVFLKLPSLDLADDVEL